MGIRMIDDELNNDTLNSDETSTDKPVFTPEESRVVACLMEKELTTPNSYPLTMNSLMLACNQKSNRDPVMNMTLGQVGQVINSLRDRDFARSDYGSRAEKLTHRARIKLMMDKEQQAVMTVLMLREPMTISDIQTRTARMVEFASTDQVHEVLTSLESRNTPLVVKIPAAGGRREDRYTHLLCGEIDISVIAPARSSVATTAQPVSDEMQQRIEVLEQKVAELEKQLDLMA